MHDVHRSTTSASIVATDSSAILGIGDQGWDGLGIAIGKLALYTVAGGVSPYRSLPVVPRRRHRSRRTAPRDPAYLGVRQKRAPRREYLALRSTVRPRPCTRAGRDAVIQWEDFAKDTAFDVLDAFRERVPSFNDDIQGTGAVALAGLLVGAMRELSGRRVARRGFLVFGAGAGGIGVAWAIRRG